jgi:predicted Zn finger-like uncharacterized protein
MIKRYNNISLALGAPGLILQIAGNVMTRTPAQFMLGLLVSLVGTGLLMAGLAFYALSKGRSPAWCLMGLLSIVGLIVLACLKDLAPGGKVRSGKRTRDDDYEDDDDEDDRPRRRRSRDEEEDFEDDDDRPRRRRPRDDEEDDEELDAPPPPPKKKVIADATAIKPADPDKKLVTCPHCQKSLKVPASAIGKKVKCPGCSEVFAAT